jgi:hypothetical protein
VAQWKRGGPITHRSQDRNLALIHFYFICFLSNFFLSISAVDPISKHAWGSMVKKNFFFLADLVHDLIFRLVQYCFILIKLGLRTQTAALNFLHFGPSTEKNSRLDPKKF